MLVILGTIGIVLVFAVAIRASATSDAAIDTNKRNRQCQVVSLKQTGCVLHAGAYARGEEVYVLPEHKDVKAVSHWNEGIYADANWILTSHLRPGR